MALKRPDVITKLEDLSSIETQRVSLSQIVSFVKLLRSTTPLADVAASTNLTEEEVIDLGARLGTWLTHVSGSVDAEIILAVEMEQPQLFHDSDDTKVIIPVGFERRPKQRREINRSLATIIRHNPDEATLSRFLDRLYPSKTSVLAARDVFIVWRFAQLGRLDGLANISPNHPAFCRTMVSAYNLLETAIADAEQAVNVLVDESADLESLASACVKVRWMNEARIGRLERQVQHASSGPTALGMLRRHQRTFAIEVSSVPAAWRIDDISQLREGQVLRLVQASGLVNEESARREALEIRTRLIELDAENGSDLSKDLDLLVPEGVRAKRAGLEMEFWDAIESRLAGDPDWRDRLESAFPR